MEDGNKINKGLRFFVATVICVPFYFSMQSVLMIPKFEEMFASMLSGKPLPYMTRLFIASFPFIALVPLGIFVTTLIILFKSKREEFPYYVAGVAFILSVAISLLCWLALNIPMVGIIEELQ